VTFQKAGSNKETDLEKNKALKKMGMCCIHHGPVKDMVTLSCFHSFCYSCLARLVHASGCPLFSSNSFCSTFCIPLVNHYCLKPLENSSSRPRCPECQIVISEKIKEGEEKQSHPKIFFSENISLSLRSAQERGEECPCGEEVAQWLCIQCEDSFCDKCKRTHQKTKMGASHTYKKIERGRGGEGKEEWELCEPRRSMCERHEMERDTMCRHCDDILICPRCAVSHHNGHHLILLQDHASSFHQSLSSIWVQVVSLFY